MAKTAIISPTLTKMLQAQSADELEDSAYYYACDFWARAKGWRGSQDYFEAEKKQEHHEARLIDKFLIDYGAMDGGHIPAVEAQTVDYDTLEEAFEDVKERELKSTASLEKIAGAAMDEGDYMTMNFAQKMLKRQKKTLVNLTEILRLLARADGDPSAILRVDRKIGKQYA